MVRVELFYSPTCSICPKAREVLVEVLEELDQKILLDEVNVLSQEGLGKAKKHGVMTVPVIIIDGQFKFVGVPSKDRLLRILEQKKMKNQMEGEKE